MYSFFYSSVRAFFDTLFPLSAQAASVRDATFPTLMATCARHVFQDTIVLSSYRIPLIRTFIHEAKFQHNERAIELLGQLLGEYVRVSFQNTSPNKVHSEIHLVPIPLSAERLRERGYNQTLEIASAAQAHVPHLTVHETLLQKIKHTPSQTSLLRTERLKNLNGVFAVGVHALPYDAHLILFDDIVTTGSTLAEATRILREAGFTHIEQLALAH
jgi:ComF family protein